MKTPKELPRKNDMVYTIRCGESPEDHVRVTFFTSDDPTVVEGHEWHVVGGSTRCKTFAVWPRAKAERLWRTRLKQGFEIYEVIQEAENASDNEVLWSRDAE